MNIVTVVSDNTAQFMRRYYKNRRSRHRPNGAIFQARDEGLVVILYDSNKVLIQGDLALQELLLLIKIEENFNFDSQILQDMKIVLNNCFDKKAIIDREIEKINSIKFNSSCIGSDEVGTGDYFGPIVVVACYVPMDMIDFLKGIGVDDSKKFNNKEILDIVPLFLNKVKKRVCCVNNKYINECGYNLNKLKSIMHNRVLSDLKNDVSDYDNIIVDKFTNMRSHFSNIKGQKTQVKDIIMVSNGESVHLSVACASMIARFVFINEMNILSKEMKIPLPYGAGYNVIVVGKKIIGRYGIDKLWECSKYKFNNTSYIIDRLWPES